MTFRRASRYRSGASAATGNLCVDQTKDGNIMRLISLIMIASLFLFLAVIPASRSHAYTVQKQDEPVTGMFAISPTSIDVNVLPGSTVSRDVTIANRLGQTITVDFRTEDFAGSQDPASPAVLMGSEDSPVGAKRWLKPEVDNVVINQGESISIRVEITVPDDAEPGGHYAALMASFSTAAGPQQTGVRAVSQVGCFFLIKVAGAISEQGTLSQPEISGLSRTVPVKIGLIFSNQGNVHVKPSGMLLIKNIFGRTVAEIPVAEWTVLPEASRRTEVSWDPSLPFGRYTAEARINFGDDSKEQITSTSFWVFPLKVLVPLIVFLAGLGVLTYLWIRRRRAYHPAAPQPPEPAGAMPEEAGAAPEFPKKEGARYVSLDWLFPSMGDSRMVDISDAETRELIHSLIMGELDFARNLINQGHTDEARKVLKEIRAAALRSGFISEVVFIDDLLVSF